VPQAADFIPAIEEFQPGRFGKWVWGQYAPLMPIEDFERIIEKAKAKGWF
jgi:hypothetical protein